MAVLMEKTFPEAYLQSPLSQHERPLFHHSKVHLYVNLYDEVRFSHSKSIPLSKKIEDAAKYLDPRLYLTSTLLVLFNWWSLGGSNP